MIRRIIEIDEEKCNGCGICANACHEGAIAIVDGKAKLMREDFCDGFGDCLPGCPTGAIAFIERDAPEYDEKAVLENKRLKEMQKKMEEFKGGCPGSAMHTFDRKEEERQEYSLKPSSQLRQWPCQIKLVPINAPYFNNAKLLIAADCTAYAYANIHQDYMRGCVTIIGCPKLDSIDYSEKLTAIIKNNDIKEVTVLRMEVPCCGGLSNAVIKALKDSGKFIPWHIVTFSIDGNILD